MCLTLQEGDNKMEDSECETVNNCLLVLRNVLHIPEHGRMHKNLQNHIVWNMFVQNLDQILLHLMTHKKKVSSQVGNIRNVVSEYQPQPRENC